MPEGLPADLADLDAVGMGAAFAQRELSPVEVIQAILARVEAWEPTLNALWGLEPEAARGAAKASEARWQRGAQLGPLDGVPVTLKEVIATKGVPVPMGTAATDLTPATADAPVTARLREAGAVIFARTTMPDYGMLPSGLSSFHKLARNPWALDRNPGGSSAGGGTAAAAGYGPLHLGTDLGGSVRLPAGWCGVVGFKPSFGRVPVDPPFPGRTIGTMTRTVTDAALLAGIVAAPDARDHMSLPPANLAWDELEGSPKGLRLGLLMYPGIGPEPDPEIRAAIESAADAFRAQGASVAPVAPFVTRTLLDGLDHFWRMRSWSDYVVMPPERRARILPFIRTWIEGGETLSGLDVYRGYSRMLELGAAAVRACEPFDAVISPTAAMPPFAATSACPTDDPARAIDHIGYTFAFNMSGQPAISINCGYTGTGLPIGLHIAGRRFDDLGVLRLARAWEQMRPAQRPWPRAPFRESAGADLSPS